MADRSAGAVVGAAPGAARGWGWRVKIGVIGRISRLARELEARLEPVYRARGLEPGWHDVLATLRRTGPPYQLRPTEFTDALMLTSSGTTKRLDRLEHAGLITRAADPADRRGPSSR
jgi:DNA-binding MarR family transcriptional regulator